MSNSVRPHRQKPTRLPRPWDSPGKNTGVGCHFLLQYMKVKSKSEVAQSSPTPSDPTDCSLPGSSVHGIFQARVLEWVAIAFSNIVTILLNQFWEGKKKMNKDYLDFRTMSFPWSIRCNSIKPTQHIQGNTPRRTVVKSNWSSQKWEIKLL